MSIINFDLVATTPYDYIVSFEGDIQRMTLTEAVESLRMVAPIKAIFTRPDVVATCIDMANGIYAPADVARIHEFYLGPGGIPGERESADSDFLGALVQKNIVGNVF